mmetsp:Transcript_85549/g.165757  ORF Transcript_85549/g.165757 Transcript_85549/m.165757 type:complete len:372 (-) Transcript_85549:306-1421(-)
MALVVGLAGCSAAGKSTLVDALKLGAPCNIKVVTCDDYYAPLDKCPTFELEALPWPRGEPPAAFKARGKADLNSPGSVVWPKVLAHVHRLQLEAEEALAAALKENGKGPRSSPKVLPNPTVIVVEGLLLLGKDRGAEAVRSEVDHFVLLDSRPDAASQRELWHRKYTRSHLGKPSYEQRGVSEEAYQVYWDAYVEPRWREHGRGRAATVCPDALRLDCHAPTNTNVKRLLDTGWFMGKGFGGRLTSNSEPGSGGGDGGASFKDDDGSSYAHALSSQLKDNNGIDSGNAGSAGRNAPGGSQDDKFGSGVKTGSDGNAAVSDDAGMPSMFAFAVAVSVTGVASLLPSAQRAVAGAVLVGGYLVLRSRVSNDLN